MGNLVLNGQTVLEQVGTETPTLNTNVLNKGLSPLDTSASQGPTTDLTNTTLPIFACRAWVHFNGMSYVTVGSESHCSIYASGNVSKVVRTGVGLYQIHFSTPMPDTNYCVTGSHVASTNSYGNVGGIGGGDGTYGLQTTYVGITYQYHYSSYGYIDQNHLHIAIFR